MAGKRGLDGIAFSRCPVVLVPEELAVRRAVHLVARVVLGVNAREPVAEAADFAFDTARLWAVPLRAVHAWSFPVCAARRPFGVPEEDRGRWEDHEAQLLADVLRPWREKYPDVQVLEDVRLLTPAQALIRQSAGAGLVVVGQGPWGGSGSVTQALVEDSRCPVAVVP